MTSQVTNSVAKKSNYKTNSISSAASLANGDQSKRKTRGKSLSHFNLAD